MISRSMATAATAAALLVLAAGCSSDDGDSKGGNDGPSAQEPRSTTTTSATPSAAPTKAPPKKCSEVWVLGKVLPKDYGGCTLPNGTLHAEEGYDCVDGSSLYAFDDPKTGEETMYGITGKPIGDSVDVTNDQYGKDFEACAG